MNSLDSKIVQYSYAIFKLQYLIKSLKRLSSRETSSPTSPPPQQSDAPSPIEQQQDEPQLLPLLHYIVLLTGNVFSISESLFNPRLDMISNFKLYKNSPITISSIVTHVPYDVPDFPITPLEDLPPIDRANNGLKLLHNLCYNALQAYQKRLQQAKIERMALEASVADGTALTNFVPGAEFYGSLDKIIKEVFSPDDLDITLLDSCTLLNLPTDQSITENENFVETTLVDMDIRMLSAHVSAYQKTLNSLKQQIAKYSIIKKLSNPERYLLQMPGSSFTLHKLCALAIRLNELYVIIRKIGRKVYFSNYDHLYDPKLQQHLTNPTYFKLHILKDLDEHLNSTKKNAVLLATLTRFFRQGASYEVNVKNVLDFTNFLNQGHMMLLGVLTKEEEFLHYWISTEMRFRNAHKLPKKILSEVNQEIFAKTKAANANNNVAATVVASSSSNNNNSALNSLLPPPSRAPNGSISAGLDNLSLDTPTTPSRSSSRTSSITSQTSFSTPVKTSSIRRVSRIPLNGGASLPTPSDAPSRRNSISSPSRTNSVSSPTRPNSMYSSQNHSLTSLPLQKLSIQQKLAAVDTSFAPPSATIAGRRRSNSQPTKPLESVLSPSISTAASGAASALKGAAMNRSPSGSIRRTPSTSLRASPQPKHLISVEEECGPKIAKLTANQRLQHHLKEAAKQGALMTQHKEVLASVLFDPNSPSSVNLRQNRPVVSASTTTATTVPQTATGPTSIAPPQIILPVSFPAASPPNSPSRSTSPLPRTRDQVTRMNTRRNSIHQNIPSTTSSLISLSSDSSGTKVNVPMISTKLSENTGDQDTLVTKKVRFTGVPEYSPSEDAPTPYSSRILKNFAVFKSATPYMRSPAFKKKDQMLKKEESISFKTELRNPTPDGVPPGVFQIPPSNANPIATTSRLSKFKSKLI